MEWAVVIPVLAYFGLSLVKARAVRGGVWPALGLWAAMFVVAALVLSRLPALPFYPDNEALRRTAREGERFRKSKLGRNEVVLVLEGSSAVTCDVKGADLERRLRERGLPARVVQISAGGSNHFERIALLREWRRGLSGAQAKALRRCRVVLLAEILHLYDHVPLHGFSENSFSVRSVAYATPGNLVPMLRAIGEKSRADRGASLPLLPLIVEHGLFNVFRVGTFPCFRPPSKGYSANGAGGVPRASAQPGARRRAMLESASLPYPWWGAGDDAMRAAVHDWVDEIGYLGPPVLNEGEPRYRRKFLATVPAGVFRIEGNDALPRLGAELWLDKAHLNPRGADVFTAWLADEIAANWARISGGGPTRP